MTSNVGSEKVIENKRMKFYQIEKAVKLSLINEGFRPEFIGRFNEVIVFDKLSYDVIREIGLINLTREIKRIEKHFLDMGKEIKLELDDSVIELCVMNGSNTRLGARPMRNYVEKSLQDAVTDCLLNNSEPSGKLVAQTDKIIIMP